MRDLRGARVGGAPVWVGDGENGAARAGVGHDGHLGVVGSLAVVGAPHESGVCVEDEPGDLAKRAGERTLLLVAQALGVDADRGDRECREMHAVDVLLEDGAVLVRGADGGSIQQCVHADHNRGDGRAVDTPAVESEPDGVGGLADDDG